MTEPQRVINSPGRGEKAPKDRPSTSRRSTVSVISLADKRIVRSIFRDIRHTTAAHHDLRRKMFGHIAKTPKLQQMILDVPAKHPDAEKDLLQELAKSPRLKRKFLVLAEIPRSDQLLR